MSLKLDLTVAAIAEDDGRFLFVQERAARRVVLNQPAGHLEAGESLVEAVVRETREETGREFHPDAVTGLYLWQGPAGRVLLANVPRQSAPGGPRLTPTSVPVQPLDGSGGGDAPRC